MDLSALKFSRTASSTATHGHLEVKRNGKPNLVYFYAPWCKFCQKMAPVIEAAYRNNFTKINFYQVNIDTPEGKKMSQKYRGKDTTVPFIQLYKSNGDYISEVLGSISSEDLDQIIAGLLKTNN